MILPLRQAVALLLFAAASSPTRAQAPAPSVPAPAPKPSPRPAAPSVNRNLIFLDPGHGGADSGAHLSGTLLEKEVTLALAQQIRSLLAAGSVGVVLSREADPAPQPASLAADQAPPAPASTPNADARAGIANHARPVACVLLHATASGNGVHIVTSPLSPPDTLSIPVVPSYAVPWETAQAPSVAQSLRLANEIGTAISRANLPVHLSRASIPPIDNLTCAAVAVEVAPLSPGPTPVSDPGYQRRVAQAIATALLFWRGHADPPSPPASPGIGMAAPGGGAGR